MVAVTITGVVPILNKLRGFFESGMRYTPQILTGTLPNGRPEYQADINNPYSKLGSSWFWMDFSIEKYFKISSAKLVVSIDVTNLLNNRNAAIINPVTGKAYEFGDPTPNSYNDPLYPDLQAPLSPFPFNPARFLAPRQLRLGLAFQY